jgi:hypothetical protein
MKNIWKNTPKMKFLFWVRKFDIPSMLIVYYK